MEILNQQFLNFASDNILLFVFILAWSIAWKGFALWKAARLSHKKWFIIILIINSIGILEIIYLFFIARDYMVESKEGKNEN